jgi:hypothetical protein
MQPGMLHCAAAALLLGFGLGCRPPKMGKLLILCFLCCTAGGVAVAGSNAVKINMLAPDTLVADQEYLATFAAGTADSVVEKVAR